MKIYLSNDQSLLSIHTLYIFPYIYFPICIPTDRANLIHGKKFECLESPISWGYFIYLPEISMGFNQTERFKNIFSHIGKVVS